MYLKTQYLSFFFDAKCIFKVPLFYCNHIMHWSINDIYKTAFCLTASLTDSFNQKSIAMQNVFLMLHGCHQVSGRYAVDDLDINFASNIHRHLTPNYFPTIFLS